MKGKVTCPKCAHNFVADLPKDKEKHLISCPKCDHKFNIKVKHKEDEIGEYVWEEHGEPRKAVLSSIKPKTNKPMIAAIILVCVFSIGVATSAFSETFIETTLDVASAAGGTGTVEFKVVNLDNKTIDNATVSIAGDIIKQNDNNIYKKENVELGIQEIEIKKNGYTNKKTEVVVIPFIKTEITFELENGTQNVQKTEFNTFGFSIIIGIFSVFALFSVLTCLKREHFDVAVAGSLITIFSFGFFFIGSILSIIAFVIIYKSRDEFKNGDKGKIF